MWVSFRECAVSGFSFSENIHPRLIFTVSFDDRFADTTWFDVETKKEYREKELHKIRFLASFRVLFVCERLCFVIVIC